MILDTCALLWLAHSQDKLSQSVLNMIKDSKNVYVSAISAFEIGIKYKNDKLELPVSPTEWFNTIVSHHNLTVIDISPEICLKSTELPYIHKDPCDRFIIATALLLDLPVVTADSNFSKYGIEVLI